MGLVRGPVICHVTRHCSLMFDFAVCWWCPRATSVSFCPKMLKIILAEEPAYQFAPPYVRFNVSGMNVATEVYVKTILIDKLLWHKVFVDQEERKNKSGTPLKFGVLANRMRKQYTEVVTRAIVFSLAAISIRGCYWLLN